MQFEGSVILNNAKSSHRVNAERKASLALCYPGNLIFLALPFSDLCNLLVLFVCRIFEVFMVYPEGP